VSETVQQLIKRYHAFYEVSPYRVVVEEGPISELVVCLSVAVPHSVRERLPSQTRVTWYTMR
jgi:hypothetical protein